METDPSSARFQRRWIVLEKRAQLRLLEIDWQARGMRIPATTPEYNVRRTAAVW